jgi:ATP synthase subunit 6
MSMLFSPMEQFTIFPILSLSFTLNNVVLYLLIAALISPLLIYIGTSRGRVALPSGWGVISETLYRTILSTVVNSLGKASTSYFPLLYSLFYLILFSNLIGLVPYSSTPTVEFVITLTLSITLLIGVLILGFISHNVLLAAAFLPAGTPLPLTLLLVVIEVIAYTTRTLSLGLRLAVNLITGHVLCKVVLGFVYEAF